MLLEKNFPAKSIRPISGELHAYLTALDTGGGGGDTRHKAKATAQVKLE